MGSEMCIRDRHCTVSVANAYILHNDRRLGSDSRNKNVTISLIFPIPVIQKSAPSLGLSSLGVEACSVERRGRTSSYSRETFLSSAVPQTVMELLNRTPQNLPAGANLFRCRQEFLEGRGAERRQTLIFSRHLLAGVRQHLEPHLQSERRALSSRAPRAKHFTNTKEVG